MMEGVWGARFPSRRSTVMSLNGMVATSQPLAAYGRRSLAEVLAPAIHYAGQGFPVSPIVARTWQASEAVLRAFPEAARTYLIDGHRAPGAGEVFRQPNLARTFRLIAQGGRDAFYEGEIAEALDRSSAAHDGLLTAADLAAHHSRWVEPIWADYRGYRLYECPPNGQGLVALLALNLLEGFDLGALTFGSPEALHLQIEALRLAFADGFRYIADPEAASVPVTGLLDPAYTTGRRGLIDPTRAAVRAAPGQPRFGDDTVYLTVVDRDRMACSFINSLFHGWGSGVVAGETGMILQNRGAGFSLDPEHPNVVAPGKRPYHTIIPAMVTHEDRLFMSYGVMGGLMQPQGHVQVLCNIVDWGMEPQTALDAPRFRIADDAVALEPQWPAAVREALTARGHRFAPVPAMGAFGGGQIVMADLQSGALLGASEPRKDGCAIGW